MARTDQVSDLIDRHAASARAALRRAEAGGNDAQIDAATAEWLAELRQVATIKALSPRGIAVKLSLLLAELLEDGPPDSQADNSRFVLLASALADAVMQEAERKAAK